MVLALVQKVVTGKQKFCVEFNRKFQIFVVFLKIAIPFTLLKYPVQGLCVSADKPLRYLFSFVTRLFSAIS